MMYDGRIRVIKVYVRCEIRFQVLEKAAQGPRSELMATVDGYKRGITAKMTTQWLGLQGQLGITCAVATS
jgi:hypothetical protein